MTDSDKYTLYDQVNFGHDDRHHYLTTLIKILRGELAASTVLEIDCRESCSTLGEAHPSCDPVNIREEDQETLIDLVNSRPWMYEEGAQFYLESICAGDEDAVLCLLLPLLSNLRRMTPPPTRLLPKVISRIAVKDSDTAPKERVFSKLVYVWTRAYNAVDCGMSMEDLANFAAIPSVKRITADGVRNQAFDGWPEGLPKSKASEVYFMGSSVGMDAIHGFVSGFTGPTIFRQDFAPLFGDELVEWDHCKLLLDEGWREVTFTTEYERDDHRAHRQVPGFGVWERSSFFSDGMNDMYDGTVHDWKNLVAFEDS